MRAVIDSSAWQANSAFNSTAGTLAPGWTAPNFAPAVAKNVAGVIARCSIGNLVDPYYQPTIQAARQAPIAGAAYHWNKPHLFSTQMEVDTVHKACALAPPDFFMADIEEDEITLTGRQFLDWVFDFMERVQVDRKIIYTGFPYWSVSRGVTPAIAAEYATEFAKYDLMIAAYPHQPREPAGTNAAWWRAQKWPVVPSPAEWYDWARTDQIAPDGSLEPGKLPSVPPGWDDYDGWQMSSHALAKDYGFHSGARLDCNVVKDDAWARWMTPPTIPEVPVEVPRFPYQYGSRTVTLAEQAALETYKRLHPEVQRRFVGLQLACLVEDGVALGIGTAWRVQPAGSANHADPGKSYHEGCTVASKQAALAIDTVAPPVHEVGWAAMEKRLRKYGFTSFTVPQIPANYNIENRPYNGPWDRPHIQPYEVRYGRPAEAQLHGVSSPNLGPAALGKSQIPPQYDLDLIDINNPLAGAVVPGPHPPQPIPPASGRPPEEDDMSFRGYYQLKGSEPGIWAAYDGAIKAKTWVCDLGMMASMNDQLKGNGYTDAQLGLNVTDDVNGFRALGPILGTVPAGVDPFGIVLPS